MRPNYAIGISQADHLIYQCRVRGGGGGEIVVDFGEHAAALYRLEPQTSRTFSVTFSTRNARRGRLRDASLYCRRRPGIINVSSPDDYGCSGGAFY